MTNFSTLFAALDAKIINAVGDDIILTPPTGAPVNARCVMSDHPGSGGQDVYSWTDNIWAKIDVLSIIVELQESAAPGIAKSWTATYHGATYAIPEIVRKGDGTIALVLSPPGSTAATTGNWR